MNDETSEHKVKEKLRTMVKLATWFLAGIESGIVREEASESMVKM